MLGQRAIYHEGWLACTVHPPLSGWGKFEHDVWELYDVEHDRSQSNNLADREPQRLEELKALWFEKARQYSGLPLDDRSALEQILAERPKGTPDRDRYIYYPDCASVPENSGVAISGRSYTIAAGVRRRFGSGPGRAVRPRRSRRRPQPVPQGRPAAVRVQLGRHAPADGRVRRTVPPGSHVVTAEFTATGRSDDPQMPGAKGVLTLYVDDQAVGSGEIVTQPGAFCLVGDGICVGRDDASPVTHDYVAPFPFTGGKIDRVVVDVSGDKYIDHEAQVRGWFLLD